MMKLYAWMSLGLLTSMSACGNLEQKTVELGQVGAAMTGGTPTTNDRYDPIWPSLIPVGQILMNDVVVCTGVLIGQTAVLTSADCFCKEDFTGEEPANAFKVRFPEAKADVQGTSI